MKKLLTLTLAITSIALLQGAWQKTTPTKDASKKSTATIGKQREASKASGAGQAVSAVADIATTAAGLATGIPPIPPIDLTINVDVTKIDTNTACYKKVNVEYGEIGDGAVVQTVTGDCDQKVETQKLGATGERGKQPNFVIAETKHNFGTVLGGEAKEFAVPKPGDQNAILVSWKATNPKSPAKFSGINLKGRTSEAYFRTILTAEGNISLEGWSRTVPSLSRTLLFSRVFSQEFPRSAIGKSLPIIVLNDGTVGFIETRKKTNRGTELIKTPHWNVPQETP